MKLDDAFKFGSGRYIQQPDALQLSGSEIARFGEKAFVIGGATALKLVRPMLCKTLEEAGCTYELTVYKGYTTREKSAELGAYCVSGGFDVVVGVGGGRIMDLSKAIAHNAGLPVVTIPTQAATCAAYTPMSVMYTANGGALGTANGNFYHDYEMSAVLVDETIMIHQPPRYVASGMLDIMAKYIEIQNGHPDIQFDTFNVELYTAYVLSKYVYGILKKNCLKIYSDVENHVLSKEVHDFLFINFAVTGMISGISKALGQTALAHEMYYCARMMFTQESLGFLHGEIVGTSLILQLAYNRQQDQIPAFRDFMKKMGMPITLSELGIPETAENKQRIFDYLSSTMFVDRTEENLKVLHKAIEEICG